MPVLGNAPGRQRQGSGGQIPHRHPRKHKKAAVKNNLQETRISLPVRPSDSRVTGGKCAGALKHQAAKTAALRINDEIGKMAADGCSVTARMIPVDDLGPFGQVLTAGRDLKRDRLKIPKRLGNRCAGIARGSANRRTAPSAPIAMRGQRQDANILKCLQNPKAKLLPEGARRRVPVEVIAQGAGKLAAAVLREQRDCLLHQRDLLARQALAVKRGALKGLDTWIQCLILSKQTDSNAMMQ